MILFRLINSENKTGPHPSHFSDISYNSWYALAVNYLASRNIVFGFPDGTFRPNQPITRAELTAAMSRFFYVTDTGANNFSDVPPNHWATPYINIAHNKGWIIGFPDGTFRPDNVMTRAEAVTIINRVLGRIPNPATIDYHLSGVMIFNDIIPVHWAFYQIMEAAIYHEFTICDDGLEVWTDILSFPPHHVHPQW